MSKIGSRVTKTELQKQLQMANRELASLRRVTRETLVRLVQDREDEIRAEIRAQNRWVGARQTLLALCDAGILEKSLEDVVRREVAGLGGDGYMVIKVRGVRIWPPALVEEGG